MIPGASTPLLGLRSLGLPVQITQAVLTHSDGSVSVEVFFGLLVTLIMGSYVFTWLSSRENKKDRRDIWNSLNKIKDNDLRHMREEIEELKNHIVDKQSSWK